MKTKRVVKVVAFCLILVLFLNHIYDIFAWKDTAGDYYSSVDNFYELDEDLVDVLFVGSSRCYCTINNAMLWDDFGISSFSMSISGQDIVSSYCSIVEALKTQTPEVICMEVFGTLFDGYLVESNLYRNTLPFKLSANSWQLIDAVGGERKADLLLKWPIVHTRYKELKEEDFVDSLPYIGHHCEFHTKQISTLCTYEGDMREPIGENAEYWFRKIIELAREKDISLYLFAAPFQSQDYEQMQLNYVQDIADEYGVPMINLSRMEDELGLSPKTDFIDEYHTNYWGSEKVTQYMGAILSQEYDLKDHRGEQGYELWEEDSMVRRHEYNNYSLQQVGTIDSLFQCLSDMKEGYTIIIETNGEFYTDGELLDSYVSMIGLDALCGESGVWVIRDGEVTTKLTGDSFGQYVDLGKGDLLIDRQAGVSNLIIDDEACMQTWDGVNIIVYDYLLGEVVDAIGFLIGIPNALIR